MEYDGYTPIAGEFGRTVTRHQLIAFFVITFSLSWTFWIGMAFSGFGESLGLAAVVPGAFGPPLAALGVVWLTGVPLRQWVRSVSHPFVSPRWYVIAVVLPLLLVIVGLLGLIVLDINLAFGVLPERGAMFLPTVVFMLLLGGGQEELGWRGFALPELQRRLHPALAAIFLGVVWAVWHLPLFFLPGASQFGTSFAVYAVGVIGLSILFVWLFNRSGSVAVMMIFHGSYNASLILYPLPLERLSGAAGFNVLVVGAAVVWLVGVIILTVTGGNLGYPSSVHG